jgi:predicted outer membrane repeat protein
MKTARSVEARVAMKQGIAENTTLGLRGTPSEKHVPQSNPRFSKLLGREVRNRSVRLFFILATVLCLLTLSSGHIGIAHADTWYVSPRGNDENDGTSWIQAFQTILKAVKTVSSGDTILLDDGTYRDKGNKDISLPTLNITIQSRNGPENTIIDLENSGAFLAFGMGNTSTLDGLTIKNGRQSVIGGGAIYVDLSAPVITNCVFLNNHATQRGGAIYFYLDSMWDTPVVTNCSFSQNSADVEGGAIYIRITGTEAFFEIAGCDFSDNSSNQGGAIKIQRTGGASSTNRSIIRDSTFFNNVASQNGSEGRGGAIYVDDDSPFITNCMFQNNDATDYGGAVYIDMTALNSAEPIIKDSSFLGNNAEYRGGAIGVRVSRSGTGGEVQIGDAFFEIDNCRFSENTSYYGGAIGSSADEVIYSSEFSVIKRSQFFQNTAVEGGAISHGNVSYITVTHCSFSYNRAVTSGGAASAWNGNSYSNSIFFKNTAAVDGGAIYASYGNLTTTVFHCTFTDNEASEQGGAIRAKGNLDLVNSILWRNRAGDKGHQIHFSDTSPRTLNVDHSNIQGGLAGTHDAGDPNVTENNLGGNIDLDPKLALAEDLHLMPDSPCVDAGDNTKVPADDFDLDNDGNTGESVPYDLDGTGRMLDGTGDGNAIVDMGAYEFDRAESPAAAVSPEKFVFTAREDGYLPEGQTLFIRSRGLGTLNWQVSEEISWLRTEEAEGSSTGESDAVRLYVDHTGLGHGIYTGSLSIMESDGPTLLRTVEVILYVTTILRVPSSYATIQAAIDAAIHGDEVIVADGTYYYGPGGDLVPNMDFLGKRITVRSARGPEHTILDYSVGGRAFHFHRGETSASVLQGFTIRDANIEGGFGLGIDGGAILVEAISSPTILGCIFSGNYAEGNGASIYLGGSRALVKNCSFNDNNAGGVHGGAMYVSGQHNTVDNCVFSNNLGGGIYNYYGDFLTVNNTMFLQNTGNFGGGLYDNGESLTISGCLFLLNRANYNGGGLHTINGARIYNSVFSNNHTNLGGRGGGIYGADLEVTNCIFAWNTAAVASGGAGIYVWGNSSITNSIFWQNVILETLSDIEIAANATVDVSYSLISDFVNWPEDDVKHIITLYTPDFENLLFVDPDGPDNVEGTEDDDYRLLPDSIAIDAGTTIPWLFSDVRGSIRPVDGNGDGTAKFDMGAYEYSEYYGGLPGDLTAKAFKDFGISGGPPVLVTNFEYEITWKDRKPFPDLRIDQAEEYTLNLALVNEYGLRIELGTHTVQTSQSGYSIPISFGPEHIGTWRLRLELTSDPNMYVLSGEFLIFYKPATRYALSQQIQLPEGVDPTVKPEVEEESACFWSAETHRLYAISPATTMITWFTDQNKETPIPVVAYITYPDKTNYPSDPDVYLHIADSMAVELLPEGTRFDNAQIMYQENDAVTSGNEFSASQEGWVVIMYGDQQGDTPDQKEMFDVVRTYLWNHPQDGSIAPDPILNPAFPIETAWDIGAQVTDPDHCLDCKSGWVFFEHALYDGYGPTKAYDRSVREGPIFAVNEDIPTTEDDDLVVVWYKKSTTSEVCWPGKPVRYDPQWPADAKKIVISSGLGSGPLPPERYGLMDNMLVYNQPDREQPGYNANEEHAKLFTAQGSADPGVFPLRTDLNKPTDNTTPYGTGDRSRPYVLLKYQDPSTHNWDFEVYQVVAQSGTYILQSGAIVPQDIGVILAANLTYYIDATGALTLRSGPLPAESYYLDAQGFLVSWADSTQHFNLDLGVIIPVTPGEAKHYYIDNTGQFLENPGTLPAESYYIDIFGVLVESDTYYRFQYPGFAGQEINPPYPVNQLTFGPCTESKTITPDFVLKDKDDKFFAKNGGYNGRDTEHVLLRYFYRLQNGFWYDLNENGVPDETVGTPLPWLEALDGTFDNEPVTITYSIYWPDPVPTLHVGETLLDAKTQEGETVGLPNIMDQCVVQVLFDQSAREGHGSSVKLIDPLTEYGVDVSSWVSDPESDLYPQNLKPKRGEHNRWVFKALPQYLQSRLTYDELSGELKLKGFYSTGTGEPTLLLNTLTDRDIMEISRAFMTNPNDLDPTTWTDSIIPDIPPNEGLRTALYALKSAGNAGLAGTSWLKFAETKALTAGDAQHAPSYVTLAFNNDPDDCPGPVTLSVIKVDCPLYRGEIKVIEPQDVFEEKVTLRHNGDFGGNVASRWFQWKYLTADFSGIPVGPGQPGENWQDFFAVMQNPGTNPFEWDPPPGFGGNFYQGAQDITVQGTGQQLLPDKWFVIRYYYPGMCADDFSDWTEPQLYEGWVKRVMKNINLFDEKVKDFHESEVNTLASMISLAGERYEGDVALSSDPDNLRKLGIIETYHTLLHRAEDLTINQGIDMQDANKAILFAANRLAGIYMILGNEAYFDAGDPTIGFSTEDGQYGTEAPSIFSFQNQMDSLLEEELALLRGRADEGVRPFYNHLIWNFTLGDGEVAYKESYNITDQETDQDGDGVPDPPDGVVDVKDAMILYPQGHGDAWGHYLTALTYYYDLLTNDYFTWEPQTEAILVDQTPVSVDYRDERRFAKAAAAKAKTGAEIVNLTYRQYYVEDPEAQWQGYKDVDAQRAWGVDGWASRAGQGAFFDWVVGNAILPPETIDPTITEDQAATTGGQTAFVLQFIHYDPDTDPRVLQVFVNDVLQDFATYDITTAPLPAPQYVETTVTFHQGLNLNDEATFKLIALVEGIQRVDRTTVLELADIASQYNAVQAQVDQANLGLNPLGIAKHEVPFDIDPQGIDDGQTHFEQIYARAVQAMNNAIAVFNHANQSTMLLRRQQDTLTDFQRNIQNSEADFNNRLIEVCGYPYPDDCGPGKTYPTGYCETGPDLYHYMYVDPSEFMGVEAPKAHTFDVKFKTLDVDAQGALQQTEQPVTFHIDTDSRFGLIKPPWWQGRRKAPGEIQLARSDLVQVRGRFEKALLEYGNLLAQIENQVAMIKAQSNLNADEIVTLESGKGLQVSSNKQIKFFREEQLDFRTEARVYTLVGNALAEALPLSAGMSFDVTSTIRSAIRTAFAALSEMSSQRADDSALTELSQQQAKEIFAAQKNIDLVTRRGEFAVEQQLLQLKNLILNEASLRNEIYNLEESMKQSAGRYLSALAKAERLLQDRLRFRKQTAAQIVNYRYKDMTFRIFRNDALQKYRAQFDMAARYVYLAAKAYDYETTLLDEDSRAGERFLTDIVRQRTLGMIQDGQPLTGTGLADPMKRMWQNFQVLKGQMGFNNPQVETNRFSLRQELFRIRMDQTSNDTWQQVLSAHRVDDLWDVPEFRRYCRPFGSEGVPEPGIVIPFSTTVTSGLNFFEWPLGGGDSYYSATNFATKVRAVGVWFSNYNAVGLAQTPRIYLVPAGEDVLRTPSYDTKEIRTWQVVDQKLPIPFPIVETELQNNPDWIPTVDTIFDELFQIRRHSDFRAYHDSGYLDESEMQFDSRLVGRSVWNTHWLLIIPGRALLYDLDEGLDTFIYGPEAIGGYGERTGNGISDIKLFFETYAYSGN